MGLDRELVCLLRRGNPAEIIGCTQWLSVGLHVLLVLLVGYRQCYGIKEQAFLELFSLADMSWHEWMITSTLSNVMWLLMREPYWTVLHPENDTRGRPPLLTWINFNLRALIPTWRSNDMPHKVWDEITYPFPNVNGTTVEFWVWIRNFIPHFTSHLVTYPCWDQSYSVDTFTRTSVCVSKMNAVARAQLTLPNVNFTLKISISPEPLLKKTWHCKCPALIAQIVRVFCTSP